ncbi:MAG: aminoacyl-tRNA hydrolase [Planctomycetes bacterium]|nr:aminoacyl-tRNA hydrolase [Planctomycetota bacterium]MCB9905758.1 aminoacyl-tRNA hydrolase [Planctomycetota bacterium]
MTRLVVGLGNPGPQYEWTRHNIGFHVLDHLARHEGLLFRSARELDGYTGPRAFTFAQSFDPDALLVKPETFMNRSGEVVAPVARFLGIEPSELLVIYDDLDLPLGQLRFRPHGSSGGQNGMSSIIELLGTDRFPRLRIGIGRPRTDAARHVLERFTEKQMPEAEVSVVEASEAALDWLKTGDLEACMARYHSRWNQGA